WRSSRTARCPRPRTWIPLPPPPSPAARLAAPDRTRDRKSTRLNSSHVSMSYAVFCSKKKSTLTLDETTLGTSHGFSDDPPYHPAIVSAAAGRDRSIKSFTYAN